MDNQEYVLQEFEILERNLNFTFDYDCLKYEDYNEFPDPDDYVLHRVRKRYHFNKNSIEHIVLTMPQIEYYVLYNKRNKCIQKCDLIKEPYNSEQGIQTILEDVLIFSNNSLKVGNELRDNILQVGQQLIKEEPSAEECRTTEESTNVLNTTNNVELINSNNNSICSNGSRRNPHTNVLEELMDVAEVPQIVNNNQNKCKLTQIPLFNNLNNNNFTVKEKDKELFSVISENYKNICNNPIQKEHTLSNDDSDQESKLSYKSIASRTRNKESIDISKYNQWKPEEIQSVMFLKKGIKGLRRSVMYCVKKAEKPFDEVILPYLSTNSESESRKILYQCNCCNFETSSKSDLVNHQKIHSSAYVCNVCQKSFVKSCNLESHCVVYHNYTSIKTDTDTSFKMFKCGICNYTTVHLAVLSLHVNMHKPHDLQKFSRYYLRILSMTKSEGEDEEKSIDNIFTCAHCSFVTNIESKLQLHSTIHENQKVYKCTYCHFSGTDFEHFNTHMELHKIIS